MIQGCNQDLFSQISAVNANAVLSDVQTIMDSKWNSTTRKEQILVKATSLRASNYYELVTQDGGVPIITSIAQGGNYYPSRITEHKVYAQIIKDLVYAKSNLPIKPYNNQYGRATKGAAQALLSKTYPQIGLYATCLINANKVINSNTYNWWLILENCGVIKILPNLYLKFKYTVMSLLTTSLVSIFL